MSSAAPGSSGASDSSRAVVGATAAIAAAVSGERGRVSLSSSWRSLPMGHQDDTTPPAAAVVRRRPQPSGVEPTLPLAAGPGLGPRVEQPLALAERGEEGRIGVLVVL